MAAKIQLKPNEKSLITIDEAVAYYNMGRQSLYRLLDVFNDEHVVKTVGSKQLIMREKLDELLSNNDVAI